MAACWVEVPQQSRVILLAALARLLRVCSFRVDVVRDHRLDAELRVAVGVCRAQRALFGDWDHVLEARGIAVYGSGGGKDDVGDVVALHGAQETESAVDVNTVVLQWDLARLADGLKW